jgi:hypothetical protein
MLQKYNRNGGNALNLQKIIRNKGELVISLINNKISENEKIGFNSAW